MPQKPETVEQFISIGCGRCELGSTPQCKVVPWQTILSALRQTLLDSPLTETVKWHAPCYTYQDKNVLTLSALKEAVVISFFEGAQLNDSADLLEKPGPNSRFARYLKFKSQDDITSLQQPLLDFIEQSIANIKAGRKVSAADPLDVPQELQDVLEKDAIYQQAFDALTPGRQRGYVIHFSSAKQNKTRLSRIQKCRDKILSGKGWNER